ncbi:MAG: lactate utilization protein [Deltaproteobacteria bacterium]|nr:lactate utilization protein [Deltaproteobacteria bacterium]
MEKPTELYWSFRLEEVKNALIKNSFDAFIAKDAASAKEIVEGEIIPGVQPKTISWGGSITFLATGLYDSLKTSKEYEILDTYDRTRYTQGEVAEARRQALLTDLFITGTNAVTEAGHLVNLDMIGNRVGAITYGPKNVIILAGRNKIAANLEGAMHRIKNHSAPINAMRLDMKTPCVKSGRCADCKSPARICNSWVITEKSFPKGRIKVVLINQEMGI